MNTGGKQDLRTEKKLFLPASRTGSVLQRLGQRQGCSCCLPPSKLLHWRIPSALSSSSTEALAAPSTLPPSRSDSCTTSTRKGWSGHLYSFNYVPALRKPAHRLGRALRACRQPNHTGASAARACRRASTRLGAGGDRSGVRSTRTPPRKVFTGTCVTPPA